MSAEHPQDLDLNIARARLILAPATFLSIYIDTAKPDLAPWLRLTGGALEINRYAFAVLMAYLVYSGIAHDRVFARSSTLRQPKGGAHLEIELPTG
jgi:hypothetical protein